MAMTSLQIFCDLIAQMIILSLCHYACNLLAGDMPRRRPHSMPNTKPYVCKRGTTGARQERTVGLSCGKGTVGLSATALRPSH